MTQHNQPDSSPSSGKDRIRSFLLNPWTIGIEFFLIVGIVAGYGIATTPQEPQFEGRATVVRIESATKVCRITLRHEDGKIKKHDMEIDTCKRVTEGDVIDVVAGKWKPRLASEPS